MNPILTPYLINPVIAEIISRLSKELPADLYYHSLDHTIDVMTEAVLFARHDNLSPGEVELIAIAAAYHDAGYIEARTGNEPIGAAMAMRSMSAAGLYDESEIAEVQNMILSTALLKDRAGLHRVPRGELSKYLLDADLGNFGRSDYFEKADLLRKELKIDSQLFQKESLHMLTDHFWYTPAATKLCEQQKIKNISALKAAISSAQSN